MDKDQFALAPIISQKRARREKRQKGTEPDRAFVYFIENRDNGQTKIGRTVNIAKRISELRCSSGAAVGEYAVHGHINVRRSHAAKLEAALHRAFKAQRLHGEWFGLFGHSILDVAIREAKLIAGDDFAIVGLASDVAHQELAKSEAESGIYWFRSKGNGRAPRIL